MPLRAAAPPPVVVFVVASSPPLTTSTTSSLTTCRCAFCAWSSSSCSSSFFADFYDRRRNHYAKLAGLWASARLLYLYASSSTTSSPPPTSLHRLLRLLRQPRAASASYPSPFCAATIVETSSAGPLHSTTWLCALPCTSGIGNTGACLRPRRATGSDKPGTRLGLGSLTASSSLRPRRITVFVYGASVRLPRQLH